MIIIRELLPLDNIYVSINKKMFFHEILLDILSNMKCNANTTRVILASYISIYNR